MTTDRFTSSFPEDLYPPSEENSKEYHSRVLSGLSLMSSKFVDIGFLARNIENVLPYTISRCRRIGSMFADYRVFAYENDSIDWTPLVLQQSGFNVSTNTLGIAIGKQDRSQARRERMAHCRNRLREMMFSQCNIRKPDYVIILDADIEGGFSYEGLANSVSYGFDVTAANSIIYKFPEDRPVRFYYDSWAWRDYNHPEPHKDQEINPRQYHRGEKPIEVFSAFGGLTLYRWDAWSGDYKYTDADCDHVTLHEQMRADGIKIHMNPSQIALYNQTRYSTEWK